MSRRARLVVVLVSVLMLAATLTFRLGTEPSTASTAAVSSTMHAEIGPGYDISLTFDDGSQVLALPAGTYRVLVTDRSSEHNFHLYGPGVDETTSVESLGSATWNVTFRTAARYFFQCDPHPDLSGRFDVGAVADEPPPGSSSGGGSSAGTSGGDSKGGTTAAPKATGRILGTLAGRVDGRGKLVLTLKGKPVTTISQGSYRIVVADSAKKDDFTLRRVGAGKPTPLTGVAFVGSRTIATDLKPGQWKMYSSPREAATAVFFRVTK